MATKKITITLPEELVEAARSFTDNLSGYAAEALAAKVRRELLAEDLRQYEAEHGPFTTEELTEAFDRLNGTTTPDHHQEAA
ncbi:type II toxin-antitoxin system CcdA family antitoxin [Streptomyces sp. NPDC059479]|uniref:type II toxin-antitoxin system CcdA family antitoxin n=1 Tax=Streptomyces sp. NPDC059479 TaxID=3346848 RepID=UPI00368126C9